MLKRGFTLFMKNIKSTEVLKSRLLQSTVNWSKTSNIDFPYATNLDGNDLRLKIGDFPDEPLYTVVDNKESTILIVNDFLDNWERSKGPSPKP